LTLIAILSKLHTVNEAQSKLGVLQSASLKSHHSGGVAKLPGRQRKALENALFSRALFLVAGTGFEPVTFRL
jgi:hypothetical protein